MCFCVLTCEESWEQLLGCIFLPWCTLPPFRILSFLPPRKSSSSKSLTHFSRPARSKWLLLVPWHRKASGSFQIWGYGLCPGSASQCRTSLHSFSELSSFPLIPEFPLTPSNIVASSVSVMALNVNCFHSVLLVFVNTVLSLSLKIPATLRLAGKVRGTPKFSCPDLCSVFI